jgi:hypothetical protein
MRIACLLFVGLLITTGCREPDMSVSKANLDELKSISQQQWEKLAQKKIFLGHQSVGSNVLDGVTDTMKEFPIVRLFIKETTDLKDFDNPVFAHAKVGNNTEPISKCDDFKRLMDSGIGSKVDMAGFKFCYVDIKANTDINLLFKHYISTFEYLQTKYPTVNYIHFTVPLTNSEERWLKTRLKRLINKALYADADNIKRNEFNQLLKSKYGNDKIFDLAAAESMNNNHLCTFKANGREYLTLRPEYTDDNGHLNIRGRKHVAHQLLINFMKRCNG